MNIYNWYKTERWLYLHHVPVLPKMIKGAIRILWASVLPYQADIGEGTIIGYQGLGIVVHMNSVIGKNCRLSPNVLLGGCSTKLGVPVLGDNVIVGAGAKIIGPVHVGNNVVIGAGAVVRADIPDDCVAVGVPAKILNKNAGKKYANQKED